MQKLPSWSPEQSHENISVTYSGEATGAARIVVVDHTVTIVILMLVMITAIELAVGVTIGAKDPREGFEFSRAMIIVSLSVFLCGMTYMGAGYVLGLREPAEVTSE